MIFKTKLPDLDKFEDVVIGQEEELEPEIAQLRGYIDKKRRNAALTEVATKVSRRGTSCLAVRTSLQSAKSGLGVCRVPVIESGLPACRWWNKIHSSPDDPAHPLYQECEDPIPRGRLKVPELIGPNVFGRF